MESTENGCPENHEGRHGQNMKWLNRVSLPSQVWVGRRHLRREDGEAGCLRKGVGRSVSKNIAEGLM